MMKLLRLFRRDVAPLATPAEVKARLADMADATEAEAAAAARSSAGSLTPAQIKRMRQLSPRFRDAHDEALRSKAHAEKVARTIERNRPMPAPDLALETRAA